MIPVAARILLAALLLLLWAAFGVWSWRAVRRRAAGRFPLIERYGIGVWGGLMLVVMAIQQSLSLVDATLGRAVSMPAFWKQLPLQLLIGFPLWVWGGYLFDSMLAAMLSRLQPRGRLHR